MDEVAPRGPRRPVDRGIFEDSLRLTHRDRALPSRIWGKHVDDAHAFCDAFFLARRECH